MGRIALVIGNENYKFCGKLINPRKDAQDISLTLEKLEFQVSTILDGTLEMINTAVNNFVKELEDNSVGLFFYSGHGMQISGKNYIVPVDCKVDSVVKTSLSCYCLDDYLQKLEMYKDKVNICILDACRSNPFSGMKGFTCGKFDFSCQPKGTIIAFATSPNCDAFDGVANTNGLYTAALKNALLVPNIKIEDMFKSVRRQVAEQSANLGYEQLSWEHSSLTVDFYFSVTTPPVNTNYSDDEIYDFIVRQGNYYEDANSNIQDCECLPYVDAYEKFRMPVIQLLRAYSRVDYKKNGKYFSDAVIDQINLSIVNSRGFKKIYDRWYYDNRYVEMGDLLPIPMEMAQMQPLSGKEVSVIIEKITWECLNDKLCFIVKSNIPNDMPVIFSLKGKDYHGQSKALSRNGIIESDYFSYKGAKLQDGRYMLEITTPIYNVLPKSLQMLLGSRNRNLNGENIKFDPIWGNTIYKKQYFLLRDGELIPFD